MKNKVYCSDCNHARYSQIFKYVRLFMGCGYKKENKVIDDPYSRSEIEIFPINFEKQNKRNNCKWFQKK